jgi:predicted glycogen debranching enzyme
MHPTFGRDALGGSTGIERLEWLVTNGIGGYACGTLGGVLARRYHGLLVAALKPPVGRTLMLVKLAERVTIDDRPFDLDANRWASGALEPRGHRHLESFRLEGSVPLWTWAIGDTRLEKRVWMEQGENTTYAQYTLAAAAEAVELSLRALVDDRDVHGTSAGRTDVPVIEPVTGGLKIQSGASRPALWLIAPGAEVRPAAIWYRAFAKSLEEERGLPAVEDHLMAAELVVRLAPGATFTVVASTREGAATGPLSLARALSRRQARERDLLDRWKTAQPELSRRAPDWIRQLVLAADQFVVERATRVDPHGRSVIAGYPWFGDWGRDAMIALPGLAITTGRHDLARTVLGTFAEFVDQGMLPNCFPDQGEAPEYNTVDAALWLFQAVRAYHDATGDARFLAEIYPVLEDIGAWYERGTRHGIRVDRQDGLVRAGEPGVQLTWMDARVGDWVVTPRHGKPVEVNALWYGALMTMARFAKALGRATEGYERQAAQVGASFRRFLNPETGCLYDVVDGPKGHDPAIRPNQIFALSLPDSPLESADRRRVLELCGRYLLTSHGLRSLSPGDPAYRGVFTGDRRARDGAYHQGTVWTWLLPHYALAHERVTGDPDRALRLLEPFASLMWEMGAGTLPEVADGDAPHRPRGCFAQAWTVAETLRVWHLLEQKRTKPKRTPARRAAAGAVAKRRARGGSLAA